MSIFDDEGMGNESVQPAEVEAEATTVSDSPTDVAQGEQPALEADPHEQGEPAQEAPATPEPEAPSDDEIANLEAEAERALADEKTPKWYKNAVENVYKRKIATLTDQLEPLAQFGTPEEITQKLDRLSGLGQMRSNPQTGLPEMTTEPFVKGVYEEDPKLAYQMLRDLAELPSPYTQGWNVLHELYKQNGIDPSRLDDIKTFAANGYQLQAGQYPAPEPYELQQIPEHLRPTFASLSPERRADLLASDEEVRDANLEDARLARDTKQREESDQRTEAEREQAKTAERDRQFAETVNQKGFEHYVKSGETVFNSFVESLAKQAGMSEMDAVTAANAVLSSLEPTVQGRRTLEAFKANGIPVDPQIAVLKTQLEEMGKHIAYYEAIGDRDNLAKAVAKDVETRERLIAKGNKITAAIALKRSPASAIPTSMQNLAPNARYATAASGSQIGAGGQNGDDNFEDSAYTDILRATGFGQR